MEKRISISFALLFMFLCITGCEKIPASVQEVGENLPAAIETMPAIEATLNNTVDDIQENVQEIAEEIEQDEVEEETTESLTEGINIDFIDIGQGDCILIRDGADAMMIDTGYYSQFDILSEELERRGVDQINILVLTHPDADHIGSGASIVSYYDVQTVYMPKAESDSKSYGYLMDAINTFDVPVVHPMAGDLIPFGSATYEVVGPCAEYDDANSNSIIIRMVNGEDSFLFTGDATGEETDAILASGIDVTADVYKAAHHGSANDGCNSEKFLAAVNPYAMVVSCGYQNKYGHPHRETMELALDRNLSLYRTDLQGTISCVSTGDGIFFDQLPTDDYRNGNSL